MVIRRKPGATHQRGATLIEVMVSVFVFAVGVLGFSALQTRSIQANFDNAQREDVVWMTENLIGRIRVNSAMAEYVVAVNAIGDTCPANPPVTCEGAGANCSEAALAAYDTWDVLCNASAGIGVVNDLDVELTCEDADAGDGNDSSEGSDLTLSSTWCTRGTRAETEADCPAVADRASYVIEFRP